MFFDKLVLEKFTVHPLFKHVGLMFYCCVNLILSNCRMNRTPIKIVAGLLHPGHRIDERDLRLDREGRHEGGARAGHEVS